MLILIPRTEWLEIRCRLRVETDLITVIWHVATAAKIHPPVSVRRICRRQDARIGNMLISPTSRSFRLEDWVVLISLEEADISQVVAWTQNFIKVPCVACCSLASVKCENNGSGAKVCVSINK